MHILIVNDDGPPSPHSSPYVHTLVRELQAAGHTVSVCLPHTQRSWIGKAHMIGQTVKPVYYRPPPASRPAAGLTLPPSDENDEEQGGHGTTHARPSTRPGVEEWILVDGTPASCVQIGLYHFFRDRGPVDLVVSGPNYGRNTTAVFALSSGTLGGALEAAVCRKRAVALSYAFFSRNHDPEIIAAASRRGVRVIEALWRDWPADGSVDLYSVNVPLVEDVEDKDVLFTGMLQNYWGEGSCFTEVDGSVDGEVEDEERIREGEGDPSGGEENGGKGLKPHTHKHFKWSPRFTDVYRSVEEAPPGNDGWAVKEGFTSVTPLKANFFQTATHLHGGKLQFAVPPAAEEASTGPDSSPVTRPKQQADPQPRKHLYALINYEDDYVQPLILSALENLLPAGSYTLLQPHPHQPGQTTQEKEKEISLASFLPNPSANLVLQISPYESIDFEFAAAHERTCLINSYMIRKALIRKHFLTATVDSWVSKHPDSILASHVKRAEAFEVDFAEFLEDALVDGDAFDLRASLERNEGKGEEGEKEWWILKPGMSDRGQGIRLFCSMGELQGIFDGWEEGQGEGDGEDGDGEEGEEEGDEDGDDENGDGIMTSHLRHFVAQPYIHPPLLLEALGNRKFHLRVYVLAVGGMRIYVYRDMLALFAGTEYRAPSFETEDLGAHLTNTCLQQQQQQDGGETKGEVVHRFWDLPLAEGLAEDVFKQICAVTGDLFEAAARGMMVHFQPLGNAFEVYGLDFLVDDQGVAWLLEVNAFPDFRQTGALKGVVGGFWEGVLRVAVLPFVRGDDDKVGRLVLVRDIDLGRRWGS
ncbi:tubulin-tyrosine ligase [Echria macrotheca]|uniref:Tubulin-tyrosine ligase n=1 Tax=Echria macrotheca TaxID=438768 RepID=A0AAJ0BMB6_9PEZI|nr:tubulin-tyrosine ligase [Echria macrotheca]